MIRTKHALQVVVNELGQRKLLIAIAGEVDIANADQLPLPQGRTLSSHFSQAMKIVVDMRDVQFCDAVMAGWLVSLKQYCLATGKDLVLWLRKESFPERVLIRSKLQNSFSLQY